MIEELAAFPRSRVAALADVDERRLDYWEHTDLISPTLGQRVTPHRTTRLYDFRDMMSVLIIRELQLRGITLHHIRQIVNHLRQRDFRPSEVVFAIAGSSVHFQTPSGEWEDIRQANQLVMHQVLDLEPIRARIREAGKRPKTSQGKTERRRGRLGSKPVLAGTRIPVSTVQAYLDRGATNREIMAAYPDLAESDIAHVRQIASA